MDHSRRQFIRSSGLALGALATSPAWLRVHGVAQAAEEDTVLVALFLRGAADGLTLAVPHGDSDYYDLRPNIRVPSGDELDLDGFFGLHPHLAPLLPLYESGDLAVLHACGSPHPSRSHFEAQDFMERAAPGQLDVQDGWLNRTITAMGGADVYTGISVGGPLSLSLAGSEPTLGMGSLDTFSVTRDPQGRRREALEAIYAHVQQTLLGNRVGTAFSALAGLENLPEPSVSYPTTRLGERLADAARIIRGNVGARIIALDFDGWDHHSDAVDGIDRQAPELANALAAFWADLGMDQKRVVCLVMTEFGRTAGENGSLGSDHGHGSAIFALGGALLGGRVLTRDGWPGLEAGSLYQGRDLAATTDFRDLFAEIVDRHLAVVDLASIFPGFESKSSNYPGLFG